MKFLLVNLAIALSAALLPGSLFARGAQEAFLQQLDAIDKQARMDNHVVEFAGAAPASGDIIHVPDVATPLEVAEESHYDQLRDERLQMYAAAEQYRAQLRKNEPRVNEGWRLPSDGMPPAVSIAAAGIGVVSGPSGKKANGRALRSPLPRLSRVSTHRFAAGEGGSSWLRGCYYSIRQGYNGLCANVAHHEVLSFSLPLISTAEPIRAVIPALSLKFFDPRRLAFVRVVSHSITIIGGIVLC